jgi:signal transduction histidine kinase/ActR/RegA family two-component response regulator
MGRPADRLFDVAVWRPALEKYGAVTRLSVALYGVNGQRVSEPAPATSLRTAFDQRGYDPGLFAKCVQRCLAETEGPPAVVVEESYGVAVVGTPLLLAGEVVGVAAAGYALVDFCKSEVIARLAREAGMPFRHLWGLARQQQPVPQRRLVLYGELLQVVGDTLLRENDRTRQYEETAAKLTEALAAKDQFLAVLSHELRTPLTPILGWARMLRTGTDPTRIPRAAEVIERNALLQVRLVEDLLELNRATQGKLALDLNLTCLGDVVRAALEAVADTALKKDVVLEFVDSAGLLCVLADEDRLQQVFRNVLVNALKFTPGGGAINVTLTAEDQLGVVHVRDTGLGIAPEFLPSVFDMFRQEDESTRRVHGGLGIGLALVRILTEAHGGTVTVASEGTGRGAEVTIRLPLIPEPSVAPAPLKPTGLRALDGLRILVVEDIDDACEAICVTLERLGAEVLIAKDGVEALARLAANPVDLVLSDLRMPRMDGFEFMQALRRMKGYTRQPVIAITGLAGNSDHRRTHEAGFEGHIDKPFDDVRLLAAIGEAMARHRPA